MAKKKKNAASTQTISTAGPQGTGAVVTPPGDALDCELRFNGGDSAGARRAATNVLSSADATADHKQRAQAVLDMVKLDWQPLTVWGAMVLVLLTVFLNAIVARNGVLKDMPPPPDLNKAIIRVEPATPPSDTVPQAPVEENRGTP